MDKEGSREELENLVRSGENLGSGLVLATSEGSGGACWTIVTFGKVSWSLAASHTVGFSAEQLTSWRRTPSCNRKFHHFYNDDDGMKEDLLLFLGDHLFLPHPLPYHQHHHIGQSSGMIGWETREKY